MTNADWLKSKVNFALSDLSVESILLDRGLTLEGDASLMTEKQRDLTRADACVIFLLSSNKGGEKKQDGNSSLTTASESFTYRDNAQDMAKFWYEKWGEVVPGLTDNAVEDKSYMW